MEKGKLLNLSVIIPTFNYANYIETTLHSIHQQNYIIHEIIVIDDGSTDDTKEVVESFKESHSYQNLFYYYQKNKGVSAARNLGYLEASGEYLMYLDADDKLLPNAFDLINKSIKTHSNVDMMFFGYRAINNKGVAKLRIPRPLHENKIENVYKLLSGNMVGLRPSSTILKRHVMKHTKYPENVHIGEDTLFFAKIFFNYECTSFVDVIVEMPRHPGSLRDNYQRNIDSGTNGICELFKLLPKSRKAARLKKHMLSRRYLQLGRLAYLQQEYNTSNKNYINAFNVKPNSVLSIKHTPRFIASMINCITS